MAAEKNNVTTLTWEDHEAIVTVRGLPGGEFLLLTESKVEAKPERPNWKTSYPLPLIRKIFEHTGAFWLVDEICRDEQSEYVEKDIRRCVFSYVEQRKFKGARILDFGSGSGASTVVVSRLLPDTEIVGVDIDPAMTEISTLRAEHHGRPNLTFLTSPEPGRLPDVGQFDYVFLTAVYEHLLPAERRSVMPMLWEALKPGGVMFVHRTPYRWWPKETHTTGGLWGVNYLPDFLAHRYVRAKAKTNVRGDDWQTLLRKGVRGGSIREIISDLPEQPELLPPVEIYGKDGIDLWFYHTKPKLPNRVFRKVAKTLNALTGYQTIRSVEIALRKP